MPYVQSKATSQTVTSASGIVLPGQPQRVKVSFCNTGASIIYLAKGTAAVAGAGIPLSPSGGSFTDERDGLGNIYTGIYSAITSGSMNLAIQEDYFET